VASSIEARGIAQARAAASSAAASPLRRATQLNHYWPCDIDSTGDKEGVQKLSCGVVEGEYTYDHKLLPRASARLALPFTAHCIFAKEGTRWILVRKHTFTALAPLEAFLQQTEGKYPLLKMNLYAAASNGLLDPEEVPSIFDTEVLAGDGLIDPSSVIQRICAANGISYNSWQWSYHTGL